MRFLLLIILGIVTGVFSSLGLGGGAVLIPLLTLFFHEQKLVCQSVNVICFLLISFLCFFIYMKEKLIDFKIVFFVSIPATISAVLFSLFSLKIESKIIQNIFAIFVILIGFFCLFFNLFFKKK